MLDIKFVRENPEVVKQNILFLLNKIVTVYITHSNIKYFVTIH